MELNSKLIEEKWRSFWKVNKTYKTSNTGDKPKFYVLDMFPYPSGAGLHIGHPLGYVASDIVSRFKRLSGFNVLHPMGFDAFGLPAEQYAIETGQHPKQTTEKNIAIFKKQLEYIGFDYDWDREINTSDPNYYKWTQWIFLKLFNHYYDVKEDKAKPIEDLISSFEKNGSSENIAFTNTKTHFSEEDWNSYSELEKANVLQKFRLAYQDEAEVNWCPALGTVLANDEVKDGLSERGGHPVYKKSMTQWFLRITAYSDRLLDGLEKVEFTNAMKEMQRNWIGRSEGASINFKIKDGNGSIEVFTTRPDTIYGATFMVLAPEHSLVDQITTQDRKADITEYIDYVTKRSDIERQAEKKVTGCFTGAFAINPLSRKEIPIYIAEYVLIGYGTGAIMAVPSNDDRDKAFAEKFDIDVIEVIDQSQHPNALSQDKIGKLINSEILDGMEVMEAIEKMLKEIEAREIGSRKVNYKQRDAGFSRQRYWGEPFPVYFENGIAKALPESELPLILPEIETFEPTAEGKAPLARATEWVNLGNGRTREVDTMPGYAGSSWYYLRYMDPGNSTSMASREAIDYWQQVDHYAGGAEHAVGHLLYSRFWNKFLFDLGLVNFDEPYKKLVNQGMIGGVIEYLFLLKDRHSGQHHFICSKLAISRNIDEDQYIEMAIPIAFVNEYGNDVSYLTKDGIDKFIEWRPEYKDAYFECSKGWYHNRVFTSNNGASDSHLITRSVTGKMGKRYHNAVDPLDVIDQYGADVLRMYLMFLGPVEQAKPWDTKGIDGVAKFLKRFWRLFFNDEGVVNLSDEDPDDNELIILNKTLQKIKDDIDRFSLNTVVSTMMIATNELTKLGCNKRAILEPLIIALSPYAVYTCEELWSLLGNKNSVHLASFPEIDEKYLKEDSITYPVSINGKMRTKIDLPSEIDQNAAKEAAMNNEVVRKWLEGKEVRKFIFVPGKIINIVV